MSVDLQVLWEKIKEEKAASAKALGINGMIGRPCWGAVWTGSWRRQGNQQGVGCFMSRTVLWGGGDSSCRRPGAEQAWLKSSRSCLWLGSEEWQEDWGEPCGTLDSFSASGSSLEGCGEWEGVWSHLAKGSQGATVKSWQPESEEKESDRLTGSASWSRIHIPSCLGGRSQHSENPHEKEEMGIWNRNKERNNMGTKNSGQGWVAEGV